MTVLGVSRDSVSDQMKFAEECELEMSLLSDPDGSVVDKYDCGAGKMPFAKRVTFVIDPKGIVRMRMDKVSVAKHGDDLIEAILELQED